MVSAQEIGGTADKTAGNARSRRMFSSSDGGSGG